MRGGGKSLTLWCESVNQTLLEHSRAVRGAKKTHRESKLGLRGVGIVVATVLGAVHTKGTRPDPALGELTAHLGADR